MYEKRIHTIDDRIVSLHMPFIRPIVRGKKVASVEFGPKLSISVVDGYTYMEKLSFSAFNEGITLEESAEYFKERFGAYPKAIITDKIYRNRNNIGFCKENNIRFSGPPLGRPTAGKKLLKIQRQQEREDSRIRNVAEGKFGEGTI